MTQQICFSFRRRLGVVLVLGVALGYAEAAWAAKRYHRHYNRHNDYNSRVFLGFRYFGDPYGFYDNRPDHYGRYAPGEHRRFPDFRLPAFFNFPGALGKGEALEKSSPQPDDKAHQDNVKSKR